MKDSFIYFNLAIIPAITFLLSIIIKGLIIKLKTNKFDFMASIGSGGMPSVHSAVASSLVTAIALKNGIHSDLFAISLTFAVIVVYDAVNVRYEAGLHAVALNEIMKNGKKYKESLGHLPGEALAGIFLGIVIALLCYYI